MIKEMTSNNRAKTFYVKLTREQAKNTWTVERVNRLDVANQYSQTITRDNKRELTSAIKAAVDNGTLYVA
jgi:hypothetical protein